MMNILITGNVFLGIGVLASGYWKVLAVKQQTTSVQIRFLVASIAGIP